MALVLFGPYRLDTRSLELRKDGRKIRLRPQPCRLLALLASHPEQLLTREELRQALWPDGVHVRFDLGLNSCLKQIRKALEESADAPTYIETLTRRGYRFVGAVELIPDAHPGRTRKIAVLPFEPIDASISQAAILAEGLTEDLTVHLARRECSPFSIVGRSAVLDLVTGKPSARALRVLGVEYLIEGRVRISDGRIRVTAKLVAPSDLSHLWAGTYDASVANLLDAQDEIARRLSGELCRILSELDGEEAAATSRRPLSVMSYSEVL